MEVSQPYAGKENFVSDPQSLRRRQIELKSFPSLKDFCAASE